MKRRKRRLLPAHWTKTTCPKCGGEIWFAELIFSRRSLDRWDEDGVLHIALNYEDSCEDGEDEHLYCSSCLREWELPTEISFD